METNQTKTGGRMLTGMFADRESAEKAYHTLHDRGYTKDEINMLMSAETRKLYYQDGIANEDGILKEPEAKIAGDALKGSAIGGTIGAIIGVIAAIGTSIAIPGLGLIIAGPIAAGLAGAGAGTITGGLIGALAGAGISEEHAQVYESGIKKGNVVIGVLPRNDDDASYIEQKWKEDKGSDIYR
ncbi:MAG: hypothetical protein K9G49_14305 [Taibaiella sp.]|nr:hypothetical protein [Taibaiella sp.]